MPKIFTTSTKRLMFAKSGKRFFLITRFRSLDVIKCLNYKQTIQNPITIKMYLRSDSLLLIHVSNTHIRLS